MLQSKIIDPAIISKNNWHQGAGILIDESMEIFVRTQSGNSEYRLADGLYIVLSQDCDIVNESLEKEPFIEIIEVNQIEQQHYNPEFSSGKNPRFLHLKLANENSTLEFLPYKRYFISRHYLENTSASNIRVEGQQLKVLNRWIYKRIVRAAFPDSFNRRIKKSIKQIKKVLTQHDGSLGMFIRLQSTKELSDGQVYKVLIKMLVSKITFENEQALQKIENGFDEILKILDQADGIEVVEGSQVQSMDDISAHEFFELKQWDFDYISFSNNEEGEVIDEEFM